MYETVSVIVPVYNVEDYLERCLRSVTSQTYKELEIIIVNDGSTDGSREICRHWAALDERITLVEQENKGLGPARNIGIKKASGEYIAFIDSDDWWEVNAVEELMKAAIENEADIVYMNFYYSELDDASGKLIEREFVQYCLFDGVRSIEEMPELLFQSDMRMWSRLLRRKLFTDNNIYMPPHPYEDFPTLPLLLLKANRICQVHKPLYHYFYKREGNLTGNIQNYKYIALGIQELFQNFQKLGYLEQYGDRLSEYTYELVKGTIDDIFVKFSDKKKYHFFAIPFWEILEKSCPGKLVLKKEKSFLFGSRSGESICKRFLFEEQIIGRHNLYVEKIQNDEINKICEAKYIFVDFLGQGFHVSDVKYIEKQLCQIIDILEQYKMADKVILLKLYYTEEHGIHRNICRKHENIDKIRSVNRFLEKYYERFEAAMNGKIKAIIKFSEIFNYTYEHTKEGCFPWYYNGEFHKKAAKKIKDMLEKIEE